jgi:hypothetical protein
MPSPALHFILRREPRSIEDEVAGAEHSALAYGQDEHSLARTGAIRVVINPAIAAVIQERAVAICRYLRARTGNEIKRRRVAERHIR